MASIPLNPFFFFFPLPLSNPKTLTRPKSHHQTALNLLCNAMSDSERPTSENALRTPENYPTPISPPLPAISKDAELSRAMTASSRSSLYSISRCEFVYEDDWLIAVNKPQGVYCESVFDSVRKLLSDSADPGRLAGKTLLSLSLSVF